MSYWDERYLSGNTGWDIGKVSPPLQHYFDQLRRRDLSILIPGCGNSYEAGYLREKGFTTITLLDISEVVMTRLSASFGVSPGLRLITGDFFHQLGQYDLIVEQTFFCALDPSRRSDYVEQTARLLRPGGKLVGLLFDRDFGSHHWCDPHQNSALATGKELQPEPPARPSFVPCASLGNVPGLRLPSLCSGINGGPPFGGHAPEYRRLLEKKFGLITLAPCYNSIKPREATELFLIAQKPG
jgi:methyl halide transferase